MNFHYKIIIEIELRQRTEPFVNSPTYETISSLVPSGSEVSITRYGLIEAEYHWQYRAKDSDGAISDWVEFGVVGNIDFTVLFDVPVVNSPADIIYEEGTTGHNIIWIATDSNPDTYSIFKNTVEITSGSWSSGTLITLNVDGLSIGLHEYKITVKDSTGKFTSDSVT